MSQPLGHRPASAAPLAKAAMVVAQNTPAAIDAAMSAQGMDSSAQLGPGRPINPAWGYSTRPRAMDYTPGVNIATGDNRAAWGRTSFATLRGIIDAYDVARACISHKIDELLSMEPLFLPADGISTDVDTAIDAARAALEFPDRELPFDAWLSKWLEDVFRYDAGTLYRRRNLAGEVIGLEVVDGTTIRSLVDAHGRRPIPPAPAWQQIIHGLPTVDFTRDDLIPTVRRPQPNSPFGLAPMESILLTANTDLKFQLHFMQMFTDGTTPAGFLELPENLSTPDQIAEFQDFWDAMMAGDQAMLRRLRMVPFGTKLTETRPASFDTDFAEYLATRTAAAFGVVPQDLGIVKDVNRCHSADTEVLTARGWLTYDQVQDDDLIGTVNPETRNLEFHPFTQRFVYDYSGDLLHFQTRAGVDALVTPNHRMWVSRRTVDGAWTLTDAENLTDATAYFADHVGWDAPGVGDVFVLPTVESGSHRKPEREIPMDLWLEFLGYVISEGCVYRAGEQDNQRNRYHVSISQSTVVNAEKAERIGACLQALPIDFRSYVDNDGVQRWQVSDKPLWTWLAREVGHLAGAKRLPAMVGDLSQAQARILFDALMVGDGSYDRRRPGSGYYATSSRTLADDVQTLMLKLGYRASVCRGTRTWHVNFVPGTRYQISRRGYARIPYEGKVWCFEVPNHVFVTRRNGKVGIHGNSNGETQTDVQFRVNTLPWVNFVQGILSRYLRYDLGLPVQVKLDTGRDKEDRLAEAQAWQIYVNSGAASVDEMRQELLGLPTDNERPVPRFIDSARTGPVPLRSLFAIAGPIDPETGGPAEDQPLDTTPFDGVAGVLPDKSPGGTQFKRAPIDPDDPAHPDLEHVVPGSDVLGTTPSTKPVIADPGTGAAVEAVQSDASALTVATDKVDAEDVAKEATAGVTAATGITGSPLAGTTDDDEDDLVDLAPSDELVKAAELASFRRFVKARAKAGRWRDFTFTATDTATAHALNKHARARIRKTTGQVVAAGLAVVAADTGRVLMLQRALDPADPNGGCWEFPGGCVEDGENPCDAADREWSEETGLPVPTGQCVDGWTSANGVYAGYVQVVPAEAGVPIFDRTEGSNPDDPDGDAIEALAWWEPAQLAGNPAVRPELAATLDAVLPLLEVATPGKAPDPVTKAWRDGAATAPIHAVDLRLVDYWTPRIAAALTSLVTPAQIRAAITAARGLLPADGAVAKAADPVRDSIVRAVTAQLGDQLDTAELEQVIRQVIADGYLAGGMAARKQLGPNSVTIDGQTGAAIHDLSWDTWQPGDVDAAIQAADGGLAALLDSAGIGIKGMAGDALDGLGNAIADGLLDGSSVDDVAGSLSEWATGFRAERIAHTELARSVDSATQSTYVANGIDEFDIVLSDGACPDCEDAAADGPYPSGDSIVPVHPLCRCASSPHVPDDWTGSADTSTDDGGDASDTEADTED